MWSYSEVSDAWKGVRSIGECARLPEELVLRWVFPVTGPPYNSPHWSQEAEGHCVAIPCATRGLIAKPGSGLGTTGVSRAQGWEHRGEAYGARF